jgi:hypothetical protein
MTVTAFFSPARPSIIRRLHDGPLGSYIDECAARLAEQGFSRETALRTLRLIADLSRWLEGRGLGVDCLDEAALGAYQSFRARTRPLGFGDPTALRRLLGWMRELNICVTPAPVAALRPWAWVPEFLICRPLPSPAYDPVRDIGEENRTPSLPLRSFAAYITSTISLPPLRD